LRVRDNARGSDSGKLSGVIMWQQKLTEKVEKLWTNLAWWTPDIKRWNVGYFEGGGRIARADLVTSAKAGI